MDIRKIDPVEMIRGYKHRSKRKVKQKLNPKSDFAEIFADIVPKNIRYKGNNQFEAIDQSRDPSDHSIGKYKRPYNTYLI